eukprot:scaffold277453_cov40-Tisochrysis_lutea.AAC.2
MVDPPPVQVLQPRDGEPAFRACARTSAFPFSSNWYARQYLEPLTGSASTSNPELRHLYSKKMEMKHTHLSGRVTRAAAGLPDGKRRCALAGGAHTPTSTRQWSVCKSGRSSVMPAPSSMVPRRIQYRSMMYPLMHTLLVPLEPVETAARAIDTSTSGIAPLADTGGPSDALSLVPLPLCVSPSSQIPLLSHSPSTLPLSLFY